MLLLYFLILGLLLGRMTGGRLEALSTIEFRWWGLALGGLVFQVLLFSSPIADQVGAAGPFLYVASSFAVFLALLPNLRQPGFPIIALGAALNLAVIAANGGYMPSAPEAWAALNGLASVPTAAYSNSALIHPGTLLPFLGDIFVLPRPLPFANVFSIGDVAIGLGAAWFLVRTMRGRSVAPRALPARVAGSPSAPR